jgi:hypothetical protein
VTCASLQEEKLLQIAELQHICRTAEYAWIGYKGVKMYDIPSFWKFRKVKKAKALLEKEQEAVASFYWWTMCVLARLEGRLDAWEGIRIVRDSTV